jgi:GT2 family glycosyltransferase
VLTASVCIPTYNRRAALLTVLRAFERQTVPHDRFEVIVAVDGSTDGTEAALAKEQLSYALRWIVQPNRGIAAARNAAARMAKHPVIIFLDDDQIPGPGLVAAHLSAHERDGDVVVQGTYPLAPGFDRLGASLAYERSRRGAMRAIADRSRSAAALWAGNFSVRRDTWQRADGFDETFTGWGSEDTDFGLRLHALSIPLTFREDAISYHQHRVGQQAWRRQADSAGRAAVQLARKHGVPLTEIAPTETRGWINRALAQVWRRSPGAIEVAGQLLVACLWLADRTGIRPLQLGLARMVRRIYKVGGITLEMRRGATAGPLA